MRHSPVAGLGPAQWAVLVAGLLTVLAAAWIMGEPSWSDWYVRVLVLPRLEAKYGFTTAEITISPQNETAVAVATVAPNGLFGRIGVRPGDRPFAYHGHGWWMVSSALADAERGEFAAFDVVNVHDWMSSGRRSGFRTLSVNPRDTEVARPFYCDPWQLAAPAGTAVLVSVRPAGSGAAACDLWIRDEGAGTQVRIHSYASFVAPVWSTDGAWVALTDEAAFDAPRCVLIDARTGASLRLSELLTERDTAGRPPRIDRVGSCAIFGWVRGTPRIALSISGYHDPDPSLVHQNLFYDVAARTFTQAAPQ